MLVVEEAKSPLSRVEALGGIQQQQILGGKGDEKFGVTKGKKNVTRTEKQDVKKSVEISGYRFVSYAGAKRSRDRE